MSRPPKHTDRDRAHYDVLLERLIEARRRMAITQGELAKRLGKTQSQISKLERGELGLGLVDLVRWCRVVDVDPVREFERFAEALPSRRRPYIPDSALR